MKIYGRNAIEEAIKSGATIEKLEVQRDIGGAAVGKIIGEAKERGIRIIYRDKKVMDAEVERNVRHQGFIAETTDFKYSTVEDILTAAEAENVPPFVVILDGVEDPHNLGSVLRVAECAGVHGVIIPERRAAGVNETVVKVSAGASAYVKVAKVRNVNDVIDKLKQAGLWIYCADMDGEPLYKTNLTGPCALVIGGEGGGVARLTREKCDGTVSIPMHGKINSLNASVAAGIVIYERVRQLS